MRPAEAIATDVRRDGAKTAARPARVHLAKSSLARPAALFERVLPRFQQVARSCSPLLPKFKCQLPCFHGPTRSLLKVDRGRGGRRIERADTKGFAASRLARSVSILAVLILCFTAVAHGEKVEQLSPQGYVNDFAGVVDADSRAKLTALCQELDQKANAQIAVVTIHSLEGDTAANFANRLFEKWGVGPKGKDRGVMILIAVNDHQYWAEVGYGLEPILPDGKVGGFGREMLPLLRQNQYGPALWQIASEIASVIAEDGKISLNQPLAAPGAGGQEEEPSVHGIPSQLLVFLVLLLFFGGWRILAFLLAAAGWTRYRRGRGYRGGGFMGPMGGYGGGGWGGGGFGGGGAGFGGFGGGGSGGGGAGGGW
jgi:uncharacterized protein